MTVTGDLLLRIMDERVRLAQPDPRMALTWLRGTVVSVSAPLGLATVRLDGASQPTSGIRIHRGLGVVPAPDDEVVVLRRGDGSYLMVADLTALISAESDVTTLPTVVFRASGGDDAPALRSLLAAVEQGTTILLPDHRYLLGSEVTITRSNIRIVGRGVGGAQYGDTHIQRITVSGGAVLRWASATLPPYSGGFPLAGGEMEGVRLDANGLAAYGLELATAHLVHVRHVWIIGATVAGLHLKPLPYATAYDNLNVITECSFRDMRVLVTGSADAIRLDGDTAWAHVPYGNYFAKMSVSFENGRGIYLGACDSNQFMEPTFSRVAGGTGKAIEVSVYSLANRMTGGYPLASGGSVTLRATGNRYGELQILGMSRIDTTAQPVVEKGAALSYIDDLGRASGIIPDPRSFSLLVYDDFASSVAADGWSTLGGTVNYGSSVADHPGISNIATGAVSGTLAGIGRRSAGSSGLILPSEAWEMWVIFRLNTITSVKCRVGLLDAATETSDPPTNGIYAEFIAGTDTSWQLVTRSGGTETRTTTGVAVGAGTWVKAHIRRRTPSDVGLAIGNVMNQNDQASAFTNVPTALLTPAVTLINTTAADRTLDVDLVLVAIRGLDR
ncbi:hypothetical protein BH23CHL8_BH23CHL8_18850 [soil metagenome]